MALNLANSVGHLKTDRAVESHLRVVADHLRPGGLYLLGVVVLERGEPVSDPWVIWDSVPTDLPQ